MRRILKAVTATVAGVSFGGVGLASTRSNAGHELAMWRLAMRAGCPEVAKLFSPDGREDAIAKRIAAAPLGKSDLLEPVSSVQAAFMSIRDSGISADDVGDWGAESKKEPTIGDLLAEDASENGYDDPFFEPVPKRRHVSHY